MLNNKFYSVVYWIKAPQHTNPFIEGYVGVSTRFEERIKTHLREINENKHCNKKIANGVKKYGYEIKILIEGSEDYCYLVEEKLRPERDIGWNFNRGGLSPIKRGEKRLDLFGKTWNPMQGKTHSLETKNKMSAASKGKEKSAEHKQALSGRKLSTDHKTKLSIVRKTKGIGIGNTNVKGKRWWNDGIKNTMAFEQPSPVHKLGRI